MGQQLPSLEVFDLFLNAGVTSAILKQTLKLGCQYKNLFS